MSHLFLGYEKQTIFFSLLKLKKLSWFFLSIGIFLGSWWAYHELGWGGWWFWDPIEIIALLFWLTLLKQLHPKIFSRGFISILSFESIIFLGAFLYFLFKSGVLLSVHSFSEIFLLNFSLFFFYLIF